MVDESTDRPVRYEIKVIGALDDTWSDWFEKMTISTQHHPDGATITTLTGDLVDQAALHGILNKIWDLNLELLSVVRIADTSLIAKRKEMVV